MCELCERDWTNSFFKKTFNYDKTIGLTKKENHFVELGEAYTYKGYDILITNDHIYLNKKDEDLLRLEHNKFNLESLKNAIDLGLIEKNSRTLQEKSRKYKTWVAIIDDLTCIFGSNSKVITIDGKKKIKDVVKGDFVLTHLGNYKKVLNTFNREITEEEYKIKIHAHIGKRRRVLSVTNNHPLLIKRNNKEIWIKAENLKLSDEIMVYSPNNCKNCGEPCEENNYFCSINCSTTNKNKDYWSKNENILKMSKLMKEELEKNVERKNNFLEGYKKKYPTKESRSHIHKKQATTLKNKYKFDKKFYDHMKKSNQEKGKRDDWGWKNKDRHEKSLKIAWKNRGKKHLGGSRLEYKMRKLLEGLEIKFEEQKYLNDGKRMWCDFFIPKKKLIIECNGEYYHTESEINERTNRLNNLGFNVLNFWGKDILNSKIRNTTIKEVILVNLQ